MIEQEQLFWLNYIIIYYNNMLKRTLGILTIWFGIWTGWYLLLEKKGVFDPYPREASVEYLERKQREIINILNQDYTPHIQHEQGTCTLSLTGKAREKIFITLVCSDRFVMPHIQTRQYSAWNFSTRIDGVDLKGGKFGKWECITIRNDEVRWTTCKKDETQK